MDKTPTKLLIEIFHPNKTFELFSNEIINLEEIKNKIKQELNITEEQINKINILYIDSDGDKNLILDNNDLFQFIMEQKQENEFLIKLRLELSENIINNNENIIKEEYKNNKKEEKNENIMEKYEKEMKKLLDENSLLKMKINYYINRIKDITLFYEQKLAVFNSKKDLFVNHIDENAIKQKDSFKSNENIFYLNDENNEKNEIKEEQKNEDDKLKNNDKNDNLNDIVIPKNIKELSNIYNELRNYNFKCHNCQNYCIEHIFICLFCNSFYLCNKCYKNFGKIKHEKSHVKEAFFEIKFYRSIKLLDKIETSINEFNEMLKNIFFEEDGKISKSKIDLKDSDFKKLKNLNSNFQSFNKNMKEYFSKYEKLYINPELDKLEDKKKDLIKEKIVNFKSCLKKIL
jgi:hypothetical protein